MEVHVAQLPVVMPHVALVVAPWIMRPARRLQMLLRMRAYFFSSPSSVRQKATAAIATRQVITPKCWVRERECIAAIK